MRTRLGVSLVVLAAFVPSLSAADDPWIEVKSPNFTVVSNAGEGRARNVRDEAIGHARASRALAQTDDERGAAEELIAFLTRQPQI